MLHSKFNEEFEVSGHQQKRITKQNKRSCNNKQEKEGKVICEEKDTDR